MSAKTTTPEAWTKITPAFDWQSHMYQRRRDGLVLAIEGRINEVITLPENYEDDYQAIDSLGEFDTPEEALAFAVEYMEDNPR